MSLTLGVVLGYHCPVFTCNGENIGTNICGKWVEKQVLEVNSKGCQEGHHCSAYALMYWANFNASVTASSFPCSPDVPVTLESHEGEWAYAMCPTRRENKDFKSGSLVLTCSSSLDCVLSDSTVTTCECVLRTDGLGVCQADISSEAFAGYWLDCGSENVIRREETYQYWSLYATYWILQQSNIECLDVFLEDQTLRSARSLYDQASALTLVSVCLLV